MLLLVSVSGKDSGRGVRGAEELLISWLLWCWVDRSLSTEAGRKGVGSCFLLEVVAAMSRWLLATRSEKVD